jgi:hypothetical protein
VLAAIYTYGKHMNHYLIDYFSEGNLFKGRIHISADKPSEAMGKFFDWLKTQEVWNHMWRLKIDMSVIESL